VTQLLTDRDVDDPREIAVGYRRAHESLQTLEFVAELDAGREANFGSGQEPAALRERGEAQPA